MLKFLLFLISLIVFLFPGESYSSPSEKEFYSLTNKFARDVKKKYNLNLTAIGGGGNQGLINSIILNFEIKKPLSKMEARKLLLSCTNEYLNFINTFTKCKSSYASFPLTYENISISIFIHGTKNERIYHPNVGLVKLNRRGLTFNTYDSKMICAYESSVDESHEEALEKIKNGIND